MKWKISEHQPGRRRFMRLLGRAIVYAGAALVSVVLM